MRKETRWFKKVWQCNENTKIKFGISKCAVVSLQSVRKGWEGIDLPNREEINEVEGGSYKYLGVLELDRIMWRNEKEGEKSISKKNHAANEKSS